MRGWELFFSLFFPSAVTLTKPSLKYLLAVFSATGLEEIRIFKGLAKGSPAFSDIPFVSTEGLWAETVSG